MKSSKIFKYKGIEIDVSVNYGKAGSYFSPAYTLSVKNGDASINYDGNAFELKKDGKSLKICMNDVEYDKGNIMIFKHVNNEEKEGLIKGFMDLKKFNGLKEILMKFNEEKGLQDYVKSESELLFQEL